MVESMFERIAARYTIAPTIGWSGGLRASFDIEGDGLLYTATKVHCIVIANLDCDEITEYGPTEITAALEHLGRAVYLTGHNICGFDLPLLRRLRDWTPSPDCKVVDTLIVSRLIFPHVAELDDRVGAIAKQTLGKLRSRYSLEAWGARLGIAKIGTGIEDWSKWTPEMQERCVGDARICKALWHLLQPDGYSQSAIELEHRAAAICERITADGVSFDIAAAKQLEQQWQAHRAPLAAKLAQQFPGTKLTSRQQIGALLEEHGWIPEKRTEKTKQPKIDDELLETIPAIYPEFSGLAEYLLLGRRLAALSTGKQAWCKHVDTDGRIHGSVIHIGTPHGRAKHLTPNLAAVPNPKKAKPFGAECRALFRPNNGWVCVAADQASLQDRGLAHYLHPHDDGAYAQAFVEGADTHWRSTIVLGLVPEGTERDKENKVHTAIREGAKRFRYAFLYGAQAATAGRIIFDTTRNVLQLDSNSDLHRQFFGNAAHPGESALKRVGAKALQRFIDGTPGLGHLQQKLQRHADKHGCLPGLDGRRVPVRALYTSLNYIVTSSEAIICKRWMVQVYDELCARFRYGWDGDVVIGLWIHDELVCCCRPEIAEQVGEIMVRHAREAGAFYNFRVPLDADYKIGRSWAGEAIDGKAGEPQPVLSPAPPIQPPEERAPEPTAHEDEDAQDPIEAAAETIAAQPVTSVDIGVINVGLASWGIEPISAAVSAPPPIPPLSPPESSNNLVSNDANSGTAGNGPDGASGARPTGNDHDPHRGDYEYADPADEPYAPIRIKLINRGYRLARSFDFVLPGGTVLCTEDRYELAAHIPAEKKRPRKTYRFRHSIIGVVYSGTGPRRIIYNWPAILAAGPGATVFVVEGANKANPLIAAGLLATAAPHHKWDGEGNECADALAGRHIFYLEDHDCPDSKGQIAAKRYSADAQAALVPRAASFRIVAGLLLWKNLGRTGEPPHGWDVKDWLEQGGNAGKLLGICKQVPTDSDPLVTISANDLQTAEFAPMRFVVPGFIAEGLTLLAGKPKIGKSWLLMHAAVACACAGLTLGEIRCDEGDVFYAALEDNPRRLKRRMMKLFGYEDDWPARLKFATTMKKLADGGLDQIKGWIRKVPNPRLIIIDTLKMVRTPARRDQSYYEADYESVKELRDLAAAHNIAIVVVHHLRKAEAEDPFDTVSGTLGLTGAVDTIMLLYREGNGTVLAVKGRDVEENIKAVEFDRETCTWIITGDAAQVRITAEREAVLKAFDEAGDEPLGASQIATTVGMKAANVRKLLQRMKEDGLIETVRYGKYTAITPVNRTPPGDGDGQF